MQKTIRVLGLDPSFTNLGCVLADIDIYTGSVHPIDMKLISTERETSKQVRRVSDDLRRCSMLLEGVRDFGSSAQMIISEATFFSKNAAAAKSGGVCVMLLAAIGLPIIEVQAKESKKLVCGKQTASKEEMVVWATTHYPELPWQRTSRGKTGFASNAEHLADALAAIHAGVVTRQFKEAMAVFRVVS